MGSLAGYAIVVFISGFLTAVLGAVFDMFQSSGLLYMTVGGVVSQDRIDTFSNLGLLFRAGVFIVVVAGGLNYLANSTKEQTQEV
ncbi:MAG: hypothetical protein MUO73_01010 [Thermoplasmata archaeon]|nr:hypothetical protein [Thermoplasmata archaeon]